MLLAPHILTGAVIITKVQNPILGLILAFLSHYLLDLFPQKEYSINNIKERNWKSSLPDFLKVFSDIFLGIIIIFLVADYGYLILIAAFLSILPDGFSLLYFIFPKNRLLEKHWKLHTAINLILNKKISPSWGILSQIAVVVTAIIFLLL
ncbi:MAG: hypothetical protein ABIG08_00080 [bacterium]